MASAKKSTWKKGRDRKAAKKAPRGKKPVRRAGGRGGRSRFSRSTLRKFRSALIAKRERITGDFMSLRNTHLRSSQREATGDLSGYSLHMADVGTDAFDREFGISVASSEQDILYRIDRALKRIEEGAYGSCEECGCPIRLSRLKAVPWAAMCIRCKEAEEKKRGAS